jgi:hypothetical protein
MDRRNTHWNHINHSEEIILEINENVFEDGNLHRVDVVLDKLTEKRKPIARIKNMQIDRRMEPENRRRKTGDDYWAGQTFVMKEGKTARSITITKHEDPKEEEEQVDEFMVAIEAAEAKTMEIQANGEVSGTVKRTGESEFDIDGGGQWGEKLESEWSGRLGTAVVPATMDLNLEEEGTMKT